MHSESGDNDDDEQVRERRVTVTGTHHQQVGELFRKFISETR